MTLRRRAAAWCAWAIASWGAASAQAQVSVLDVDGRAVALAAPARRVISLAPHLTELMFAIGAGDRVVGTVEYADFPEAARRVPRVGDSALLDLERIVAMKPDLLLVWRHGNSPQQLQRLAALKLPTYASEARTLADIARTLRDLGQLTGVPDQAARRAAAFEAEVSALQARYAGRRRIDVFYQIWNPPLITVNGEHLISQMLELCGAHNVFAAERLLTPTVTEEAVLQANPDAIVAGWSDSYGSSAARPLAAIARAACGARGPSAAGGPRPAAPAVRSGGARRARAVRQARGRARSAAAGTLSSVAEA